MLERSASIEIAVPDGLPEGEFSGASFVLLPATPADRPSAETVRPEQEATATVDGIGMPAAIYAGTCDALLPADPVAQLADASEATGRQVGFAGAVPVATSYTETGRPFDTVIGGNHVLAIFGADGSLVACGGIGGSLDDSGALAVGIMPLDDGSPAVAYVSPLDDGVRSAVTVFVPLPAAPVE